MDSIKKSDQQWKQQLDDNTYRIARLGGTEPPFSGALYTNKERGSYHCACCGLELFSSQAKYESGSGWPSFWQPVDADHIKTLSDTSHGMKRTEARCPRCDAHLGHVFEDGPQPSGLRYCINSASLGFNAE